MVRWRETGRATVPGGGDSVEECGEGGGDGGELEGGSGDCSSATVPLPPTKLGDGQPTILTYADPVWSILSPALSVFSPARYAMKLWQQ